MEPPPGPLFIPLGTSDIWFVGSPSNGKPFPGVNAGRKLSHAGSGYLGSALAFGTMPPFLLSRRSVAVAADLHDGRVVH